MKCRFYDDGCGNGSYIPGASCGPPGCSLKGNIIKCHEGNIKKCPINDKRLQEINKKINLLKKEL